MERHDAWQPLAELLDDARTAVAFTGAGVSTESGIPDLRSPDGVWARYDPRDFTFSRSVSDPVVRARAWRMRREFWASDPQPNPAHGALADLVIAIGSSLQVRPAADLPAAAVRSGIALAIVNDEATPLDQVADLGTACDLVHRTVGSVRRCAVVGWSLGALIGLHHGLADHRVTDWVGIAPPTGPAPGVHLPCPPVADIGRWQARRDADHFLFDRDDEVAGLVAAALT